MDDYFYSLQFIIDYELFGRFDARHSTKQLLSDLANENNQ